MRRRPQSVLQRFVLCASPRAGPGSACAVQCFSLCASPCVVSFFFFDFVFSFLFVFFFCDLVDSGRVAGLVVIWFGRSVGWFVIWFIAIVCGSVVWSVGWFVCDLVDSGRVAGERLPCKMYAISARRPMNSSTLRPIRCTRWCRKLLCLCFIDALFILGP